MTVREFEFAMKATRKKAQRGGGDIHQIMLHDGTRVVVEPSNSIRIYASGLIMVGGLAAVVRNGDAPQTSTMFFANVNEVQAIALLRRSA